MTDEQDFFPPGHCRCLRQGSWSIRHVLFGFSRSTGKPVMWAGCPDHPYPCSLPVELWTYLRWYTTSKLRKFVLAMRG